jgi:hypothetical protein
VSHEGVQEVLLNEDGTIVLIENGPLVTVQPVNSTLINKEPIATTSMGTAWAKHPTESKMLVSSSHGHARIFKWEDLSDLAVIDLAELSPIHVSRPDSSDNPEIMKDSRYKKETARIQRICDTRSGSQFVIQTLLSAKDPKEMVTSLFKIPSMPLPRKQHKSSSPPVPDIITPIPTEIQSQIEMPLGVISRQRLVFLNKNYWMCSWLISPNNSLDQVKRHYFLPKDWLNSKCLELGALLPDGVFLIPNNGELAMIKEYRAKSRVPLAVEAGHPWSIRMLLSLLVAMDRGVAEYIGCNKDVPRGYSSFLCNPGLRSPAVNSGHWEYWPLVPRPPTERFECQ